MGQGVYGSAIACKPVIRRKFEREPVLAFSSFLNALFLVKQELNCTFLCLPIANDTKKWKQAKKLYPNNLMSF